MHRPQPTLPIRHDPPNSSAAQYVSQASTGMATGGTALEQA